jgi:DNA-binding winged helix-turn-helix (wHTH) protein
MLDAALARARLGNVGSTPTERYSTERVSTTKASALGGRPRSTTQLTAVPLRTGSPAEDALAILTGLVGSHRWEEIVTKLRELAENAGAGPDEERASETVEVGELRVEKHAHRVLVAGDEVALTSLEFRLLVTLVDRPDCVQSRGVLLNDVWALPSNSPTRTVDTHVRRLRDKLGAAGRFIQTVRGVGYRFSDSASIRRADGRCKVLARFDSERRLPSLAG